MKKTAAIAWITFACCIASRPWFQFGKSRMRPVTLTHGAEPEHQPAQNTPSRRR